MYGYKGFDQNWTCLGLKYQIGESYCLDANQLGLGHYGFHFCLLPIDVFRYYKQENGCKYAKIYASDKIIMSDNKCVCNQIEIIEEMNSEQLYQITTGLYFKINGTKKVYLDDQLDSILDYNLEIMPFLNIDELCGDFYWYLSGQLHREDGPSVVLNNGDQMWYLNGKLHRNNGPAIEFVDGSKYWYLNGHLHRKDGPAIETINGDRKWYLNGQLHNENGPAIEFDCRAIQNSKSNEKSRKSNRSIDVKRKEKHWYKNNQRHREDGPAIEKSSGDKYWYRDGFQYSTIINGFVG
jgi:hypothetical protein